MELLRRAGDHLPLLRDRSREARHSSLDEALDWSWQLLDPWAQAALGQLAVFEGRFDMADGEAVLELSDQPDAPWPVDVIQHPLDHSLLMRFHGQHPPLGLLVGVRAFARRRAGPELAAARARHARHMAGFGARDVVHAQDWAPDPRAYLEARLEDLEAAVRFALEADEVGQATMAAVALIRGRRRVGLSDRIIALGTRVLDRSGAPGADRARLRQVLAIAENKRGDAQAGLDLLARGAREDGEVPEVVRIDGLLAEARIRREVGDPQAAELAQEALQRARRLGRPVLEADARTVLMDQCRVSGRLQDAEAHGQRALALFRQAGLVEAEANALLNLGNVLAGLGRLEDALAVSLEGLTTLRSGTNTVSLSIGLLNTGILHARLGQHAEARSLLEEALVLARRLASRHLEAGVLGNLGELLRELGELEAAREMLVLAVEMCAASGWRAIEGAFRGALADVLVDLGRLEKADATLTQAIAGLEHTAYRTDELALRRRRCALLEQHGLPGLAAEQARVATLAQELER